MLTFLTLASISRLRSNTAYFTSYLEQTYKNLSKPIWLTEVRSQTPTSSNLLLACSPLFACAVHGYRLVHGPGDVPKVCGPVAREADLYRKVCGVWWVRLSPSPVPCLTLSPTGDFASNPVAVFVDKDGTPNDLGKVYAGG